MGYTQFRNGFEVTSSSAIDKRILLTKAEMLTAEDDYNLPDNYFCICNDDAPDTDRGKLFVYSTTFETTATTGRFHPYDEIMDVAKAINKALESTETKAALESAVASTIPGALQEAMNPSDPTKASKAEEIANALFDSDHFQVVFDETVGNKIDLSLSLIQAIDAN